MKELITSLTQEAIKQEELIRLEWLKALKTLQEVKRKHNITYK